MLIKDLSPHSPNNHVYVLCIDKEAGKQQFYHGIVQSFKYLVGENEYEMSFIDNKPRTIRIKPKDMMNKTVVCDYQNEISIFFCNKDDFVDMIKYNTEEFKIKNLYYQQKNESNKM